MNRHESIYTIALLVFVFWQLIGIVLMFWLRIGQAGEPDPLPRWIFHYVITVELIYMAAGIATLVLRRTGSGFARTFTKAFNICMLIFFPIGTALGVYGLWVLDRNPEEQGSSTGPDTQ